MSEKNWLVGVLYLAGLFFIALSFVLSIYSMILLYVAFRDYPVTTLITVELSRVKTDIRMLLWGFSIIAGSKLMVLIKEGCLKR